MGMSMGNDESEFDEIYLPYEPQLQENRKIL